MGQWATRSRRGGGPPTTPALIFITAATKDGPDFTFAEYSGEIDNLDFDLADFRTNPGPAIPMAINQFTPFALHIEWDDDISADTELVYTGDVPGIRTPQTIALT